MKLKIKYYTLVVAMAAISFSCAAKNDKTTTLRAAFKDKFYIGTALNRAQYMGIDKKSDEVVKTQFSAIVAENCMKSENIQPREGEFFFDDADKFVAYGKKNKMFITGHTLIWHSQAPRWFFVDKEGKDVSREVLIERMKNHIHTVVARYKGQIKGWDVVNEAILDNGEWRKSKFYNIIGEDFIKLAFQFAHEADPKAELYYNDYSMAIPAKREGVIKMVKALQAQGVKIHGIGMQGHIGMDYPELSEFEKSIESYAGLGLKVMITELDLSALPTPKGNRGANIADVAAYQDQINPYKNGLPAEAETVWENRYLDFFRLFLKHKDKISRVTLWGVSDGGSWKNNFPVRGRTDYPLLFDRDYNAKPLVKKIIDEAIKTK
ncbi:MAG: beta-1,4-xylanase [Bacteroidetes bacterium]|nr:beta-1,4-xylanase [Bacteroidota bacterium]